MQYGAIPLETVSSEELGPTRAKSSQNNGVASEANPCSSRPAFRSTSRQLSTLSKVLEPKFSHTVS